MNKTEKIADLKARGYTWAIPWEAVELIANAEDCILKAYKCSAGKWTIGWGETVGVEPGMVWTKEQADARFNQEVKIYTSKVQRLLTEYANPHQLGAMVSLAYNIGLGAFEHQSTVRKAHNRGDEEAASQAFKLWNKATVNGVKVVKRGLVSRRAAEAALYLKPQEYEIAEPNVQAVDSESSLVTSPMNASSAVTIAAGSATGVGAIMGDAAPIIEQATQYASMLSINPLVALAVVLIGAGAVNMYWRYKQREGGWA